jgi:pimeloyl-ACP methyl ester carboxylesterase
VAGNSLGGWVALELARLGRASAVVALSPSGFWLPREARYAEVSLKAIRASARASARVAPVLYRSGVVRRAAFAQVMAHGERMTATEAIDATRALIASPAFDETLHVQAQDVFRADERLAGVPITIAWAEKDRLLLPRQQFRAARVLPHARLSPLRGCGHVPTSDDPVAVARVILEGTAPDP